MTRQTLRALAATLACLLLGACPPAIQRNVLLRAEDEIAPVITLSFPSNRAFYDSSVTFAGTVGDSSVTAGDGEGRVDSVSYSVLDHTSLAGTADIGPDGSFAFTIDTHELSGTQRVDLTAEDWNGNSTTISVELLDPGVGPDIAVSSPPDDTVYMQSVTVMGVVNNRGESTAVNEVVSLAYEVRSRGIDGTVEFDPTDGGFCITVATDALRGDITIRLTAIDRNGRTSTKDVPLSDRPSGPVITVGSPTPSSQYQASVTVSGTVANNGSPGSTSEVKSFAWQVVGKTPFEEVPYAEGSGAFSFSFDTIGWTGAIIVELKAQDLNNRVTTVDLVLFEDTNGPYLVVESPDNGDYGITIDLRGSVHNSSQDLEHWDDVAKVEYRIGADPPVTVALSPAGTFDQGISTIGRSGTIIFQITAYDRNGHLTVRSFTMSDNLPGPVVAVSARDSYSSRATPQIEVAGTVSSPENLLDNRMAYEVRFGSFTYTNYIPDASIDASGAYSFAFGVQSNGIAGNLTVTVIANDKGGRETKESVYITDDVQAPTIVSAGWVAGMENERLWLIFSEAVYSDADRGLSFDTADFLPSLDANGGTATSASVTQVRPRDGLDLLRVELDLSYNTTTPAGAEKVAIGPSSGASVFDHVGNPLPAGALSIPLQLKDRLPPSVTGVTSQTPNGWYNADDSIDILVTFSEVLYVSGGTPSVMVETGTVDRTAWYQSGSGTDTLRFRYTVQAGDTTSDLDTTGGLLFGSATVRDAAGNAAAVAVPAGSLASNAAIVVDTTAPYATSVQATTANGTYNVPDQIAISVTFSEPVSVTGTAGFALNSGGTASCTSGSSVTTLSFTYTVAAGEDTALLDVSGPLIGIVRDRAGNDALATIPTDLGRTIAIDTTAPAVVSVASTNGTYGKDETVGITLHFAESVNVDTSGGRPSIGLTSGGTATYNSGSGSPDLLFTYTVAAGENAADLDTSGTITSPSRITDIAGNAASAEVPTGTESGSLKSGHDVVVDTAAPVVLDVWVGDKSPALTYATEGEVLLVSVLFGEPVISCPNKIVLTSLGEATYGSGAGTTTIVYGYTLKAGDSATGLDYASTTSLRGAATDAEGNSVNNPPLPSPGAAGSISGEQNVSVNVPSGSP